VILCICGKKLKNKSKQFATEALKNREKISVILCLSGKKLKNKSKQFATEALKH
jgi:hypothetical protein